MNTKKAPVLLVTFNRPDTTIKVVESLRKAKVKKLYVFNDAPRKGNKKDVEARKEILKIVEMINWDCEIYTNFAHVNLGCGRGVSSAITWAFENEDRLIILEDDCVPAQPFFNYCDELLEKYKYDTRVWMISGNNYSEEKKVADFDYFFSRYGHIWGWATWKRSWEHFDLYMNQFPKYEKWERYFDISRDNKRARRGYERNKRLFQDKIRLQSAWAHQFGFAIGLNSGLRIVPRRNLVTNIGEDGVHSNGKNSAHNKPVDCKYTIKKHPDFVLISNDYDDYHYKHYMSQRYPSLLKKVIRKLGKLVKKLYD